jgi:hypothetical protein
MNVQIFPRMLLVQLALVPAMLACSLLTPSGESTQVPAIPVVPAQVLPGPTSQPISTTAPGETPKSIRQWAAAAEASSEWGASDWAASQATGAPNTPECGDVGTAWAASGQDTREWINVYFTQPVYSKEILITQTYNPDQVVQVDLIDMQGQFVTVYTSQPRKVDSPCPYLLAIPVSRSDILAQGVRITIDQSVLGLGWNEIDAVEIVGVPGEGVPVRPASPTP